MLYGNTSQFQVPSPALLVQTEEKHSNMTPRWMSAYVSKALIGSCQPTVLSLNLWPEDLVRQTLPSLIQNCRGIVPCFRKEISYLTGQVFVNLYTDTQRPACSASGIKSAWLTASAANLKAARISSLVR